jgi:hypothetical protein
MHKVQTVLHFSFPLYPAHLIHLEINCITKSVYCRHYIRGYIQKLPDRPPGATTTNGTALRHHAQPHRHSASQFREPRRHKPPCRPQRVFVVVVVVVVLVVFYSVIDSVRKTLATTSYNVLTKSILSACTLLQKYRRKIPNLKNKTF